MKTKRFLTVLLALCLLMTMCFSPSTVMAEDTTAVPTVTLNLSMVYSGQTVRFDFTNVDSTMTFGVLPSNANGEITAYSPIVGYKVLSSTTASHWVKMSTSGYYVAAIWKSDWNFVVKVPFTVLEAPTISVASTKIEVGSSVKFTLSGVDSTMSFGVLPGNANGEISAYSIVDNSYKALSSTTTSQTVTLSTTGYYVAAIWKSDWNFVAKLPITVAEGLKVASLDKTSCYETDIITVTTKNWSVDDGDFLAVYDSSVTDITSDTAAVYSTKDNPGQASYSINTTGWQAGSYRLVAFDSGDYTAAYIADITFTVNVNKKVKMDKESYTTDDVITVTTQNWSATGKEFIRIYKAPASDFRVGVLADTHSTVWGKDTYKFYPYKWEPGTYELIAFEYNDWKIINKFTFTVTEPDSGAYTIDGATLTVNEEIALDLSKVDPEELEGKLFIGWSDAEGNPAVNNQTLAAGTVLTAQYIDYNAEDDVDFKVVDTEVRTEISTGLRFTVEQSNALYESLPSVAEYGIAVLPSDILNNNSWAELTLDLEYVYGDNTFTATDVKAEKLYATETDRIRYTACITDIGDEKLMRQYTVRGYIKYTDLNGVERVLYTDYASANMYATARADLKAEGLSADKQAVLEDMIAAAEAIQAEKYDVDKITVTGSANDLTSYVYQLGTGGIYVREAVINAGLDAPIEIVQLSDLHFNYLNARDYAEKNPTVLSTADMRTLARNGSSAANARAAVDYARTADGVVVTGDIFDYLSWGGVELMYKEVWDIIPDALLTVGNHEYLQKMLGVMPESLTADERWGILESVWKHNIYYSSKVIDDKVMLIQLNNGEAKFYESQIAPLTADIELARQNGYTVLVFTHEPICTGNSAESAVTPIRADSSSSAVNFYTSQVGGNGADDATKAVCSLIYSNADVIKGVFNGHMHNDYYTEISAVTASGETAIIPQYTSTGGFYNNGCAIKITIQ